MDERRQKRADALLLPPRAGQACALRRRSGKHVCTHDATSHRHLQCPFTTVVHTCAKARRSVPASTGPFGKQWHFSAVRLCFLGSNNLFAVAGAGLRALSLCCVVLGCSFVACCLAHSVSSLHVRGQSERRWPLSGVLWSLPALLMCVAAVCLHCCSPLIYLQPWPMPKHWI